MGKESESFPSRNRQACAVARRPTHGGLPQAASLAPQIAEFIVDSIAMGHLEFGERLIETDLARQLHVSRVPIREAFNLLEAQGILVATPHCGAHVAEFDDLKIDRIREARIALERLALPEALAELRVHPGKQRALESQVARMEDALARRNWIEAGRADLEFHRLICRASNNEIAISLWEALAHHISIVFGRELRAEGGNVRLGEQHNRLLWLIRNGGLKALDQELLRHVMRLRNLDLESQAEPRPKLIKGCEAALGPADNWDSTLRMAVKKVSSAS